MNQTIVDLLAQHLQSGLPHPGNEEKNEPPALLKLPGLNGAVMPPAMREHVKASTVMIAEAIVKLLEDHDHLKTSEVKQDS